MCCNSWGLMVCKRVTLVDGGLFCKCAAGWLGIENVVGVLDRLVMETVPT